MLYRMAISALDNDEKDDALTKGPHSKDQLTLPVSEPGSEIPQTFCQEVQTLDKVILETYPGNTTLQAPQLLLQIEINR